MVLVKSADEELELARLLAAEREGLEGSVELLRQRGPDASELASLSSRLALRGIDVSATPPSPAPTVWKRWAWGGAGAGSAVLLWLALRPPEPVPAPAAVALPPEVPAQQGRAAERSLPAPSPLDAARVVAHPSAAPTLSPAAPSASTSADAPAAAPPALTPPASAPPSSPGTDQPLVPSSEPIGPAKRPVGGDHARAASSAVLSPGTKDAPTEIELLRDARFALRQSPGRALELTEQHARFHPGGKLAQERELIAISALVALGRRTAALARGASFERAFPSSPYRKQVGDLLR